MRFIRFKNIFLTLAFVILSFGLFSCGNAKSSEEAKTKESSNEETSADFDGNVMEIVEIDNGILSKTLSKPFKKDSYTKKEQRVIDRVSKVLDEINLNEDNKIVECLYGDLESKISVWSLIKDKNGDYLNNYGIIIRSNGKDFKFADICHGNTPEIDVDEEKGIVMLAGCVMEGTGTHTDALYVFNVKGDTVTNTAFVDPIDVQNYFAENLKFDVDNNNIKFRINNNVIAEAENHEDGLGTIRAIAVGDQISYTFDDEHNIYVNVTPGLQFVSTVTLEQIEKDVVAGGVALVASGSEYVAVVKETEGRNSFSEEDGKIVSNNPQSSNIGTTTVLMYDDMPTFTAEVKINNDTADISNIRLSE